MISSYRPPSRRAWRRPLRAVAAACLLSAAGLHAQPATLSLAALRQAVRADAPRVEAAAARVEAAEADAARAAALPDPTLILAVDSLPLDGPGAWRLGSEDMTMRRIGLQQDWPSRRKREARRSEAQARVDAAAGEAELSRLEAERLAGSAWIDVWAAEAEQAAQTELRADAERAASVARAQLAGGGAAADALAARQVLAEADNALARGAAEIDAARLGLARWYPAGAQQPLQALPELDAVEIDAARLRARLDDQAELRVWAGRERAAESAVVVAKANRVPDLGFTASYGARSAGLADLFMFEVRVGLPLFARGRQDRDVAARLAERDALRAERDDARLAQREQLERLLLRWRSLQAEARRYAADLLPLARDRSSVALAAYSGGAALQPWIEARRVELDTRRRAVQLRAELARTWLQLDTLSAPAATAVQS